MRRSLALPVLLTLACRAPTTGPTIDPTIDPEVGQAEPEPVVVEAEPTDRPPAPESIRYPNELPGYQFFADAAWRELVPLESTLADVRRVLGEPDDARDIAQYTRPYPGDDQAIQPVLTYDLSSDWDLLVYLVRSDLSVNRDYPASVQDRLLSLELVPDHDHPFLGEFSERWKPREVMAADAGWITYEDGSGLAYQVYRTDVGSGEGPGDLNRIVYGPSDAQKSALGVSTR
ncbi:hypothetical protein ACNOYE_25625 [Nannocystaceae bacterium ST9]